MKNTPYQKIIELLDKREVRYEEMSHQPVKTSEEAAEVRGEKISQGAKSLLIKSEKDYVLVVVPGDKKFSYDKLRKLLNSGEIDLADPQKVEDIMKCKIGGCYPIGEIVDLPTFIDKNFNNSDTISFNPGVKDKTVKVNWDDFKQAFDFEIVDIT